VLEAVIPRKRSGIYVAEIGLNHNGSVDAARDMIRAAARAGADAVKFQTFVPELLVSPFAADLLREGKEGRGDWGAVEFFRRCVLTAHAYRELNATANDEGVVFFSSVFDIPSLELLESLGVKLYKIASSEVTNHPLIAAVANTGKPAILSTGMASEKEIQAAVSVFRRHSRAELVLLHCVSIYPLPPHEANMARIPALARRFGLPVGFSDHTRDPFTAAIAAAFGARLFEKHFTIDKLHECPDKEISCTPDEFSRMVELAEKAIVMAGSGAIDYGAAEAETARASRRSLFARRSIPRGSILGIDDCVTLRPGVGIPPSEIDTVVGKKTRIAIQEGYMIKREYLE